MPIWSDPLKRARDLAPGAIDRGDNLYEARVTPRGEK